MILLLTNYQLIFEFLYFEFSSYLTKFIGNPFIMEQLFFSDECKLELISSEVKHYDKDIPILKFKKSVSFVFSRSDRIFYGGSGCYRHLLI